MAEALEFHFPGVKLAIGPPIANGFYYDVDFLEYSFTEKDLEKVEAKMKEQAIFKLYKKYPFLNCLKKKKYKLKLVKNL